MNQQNERQTARSRGGARDLQSRLYREIGISAVAAALEFAKRPKAKPIEPDENPAVIRDEKAA